ncbi:MAG: FHA domain-containing protein [Armatimonadota bacterium]
MNIEVIKINTLRTVLVVVILLLFASISYGSVTLKLEDKGTYIYWFEFKNSEGESDITTPVRFKGKETELDDSILIESYSDINLFIMNKDTGNLAIVEYEISKETLEEFRKADADKKTEEAKSDEKNKKSAEGGKVIELKSKDFEYVRLVRLAIINEDGEFLESGIINLTDGLNKKHKALLTPANNGVVSFFNVASGEANIKIDTEGIKRTKDSDIEVPIERDTIDFSAEIKVAGDVYTIAKAENEQKSAKTDEDKTAPPKSAGTVLQSIAGFIFLLIIIAVIYAILKAKGVTAKKTFETLGVNTQSDESSPIQSEPQQQKDPNICQFCGQTKKADGSCACTVFPTSPAMSSQSTGIPKIVGVQGVYSGSMFEITSDNLTIGREASNPIALPNDSTVSRKHCTVYKSGGMIYIRDEGSSNGTFVNDIKITEQSLNSGDRVRIGDTIFRFEL